MEGLRLPEGFEQYAEARKNGFIKVKNIKEAGGNIAGIFCTFTPLEVLDAAGVHPVGLCGMAEETIPDAEVDLPKNLCPLIKSSYGFAVSDKCPYTYFADLIVGETTCDGKKKMYELLGELKEMYVLQLPQSIADEKAAKAAFAEEIRRFIAFVEKRFGVEITQEKLRQAAKMRNDIRQANLEMQELQKLDPPPMSGFGIYKFIESQGFAFDLQTSLEETRAFTEKTKNAEGDRPFSKDTKRIMITGCPAGGVLEKVVKGVEDNGGVVVCFENCGGIKPLRSRVNPESEDMAAAFADHYLNIGCSVFSPNPNRMALIPELVDEFKVDGVIDITLQACHTYYIETTKVKKLCCDIGVPYMSLETDYSQTDKGQIAVRLGAFLEMLA